MLTRQRWGGARLLLVCRGTHTQSVDFCCALETPASQFINSVGGFFSLIIKMLRRGILNVRASPQQNRKHAQAHKGRPLRCKQDEC